MKAGRLVSQPALPEIAPIAGQFQTGIPDVECPNRPSLRFETAFVRPGTQSNESSGPLDLKGCCEEPALSIEDPMVSERRQAIDRTRRFLASSLT